MQTTQDCWSWSTTYPRQPWKKSTPFGMWMWRTGGRYTQHGRRLATAHLIWRRKSRKFCSATTIWNSGQPTSLRTTRPWQWPSWTCVPIMGLWDCGALIIPPRSTGDCTIKLWVIHFVVYYAHFSYSYGTLLNYIGIIPHWSSHGNNWITRACGYWSKRRVLRRPWVINPANTERCSFFGLEFWEPHSF